MNDVVLSEIMANKPNKVYSDWLNSRRKKDKKCSNCIEFDGDFKSLTAFCKFHKMLVSSEDICHEFE